MYVGKVWQLPDAEDATGETDDQKIRCGMKSCTYHFGVSLVEVAPLEDTPACSRDAAEEFC